jgi:hypothetical protein
VDDYSRAITENALSATSCQHIHALRLTSSLDVLTVTHAVAGVRFGPYSIIEKIGYDLHVRVIGNVAFVQGFDDEKSSYKGKDNSGTYNWLDVWENRNGRWVSVATQLTKVEANH